MSTHLRARAMLTSIVPARRWALAALGASFAIAGAEAADVPGDYLIGAGDVVRVSVYQNADLTVEARVSESGVISYPLLGQLRLSGLSVPQAEQLIARGLRDGAFVKAPQVNLNLLVVRGHQVSVLGMVNRPGRYPIDTTGLRLSDVLAIAGGVALGGHDIVVLSGERDGKAFRQEVDLPAMYAKAGGGDDPAVRNGDVIYVDRAPSIYIYGEVQRPGALRLERDMNVMQALAAGGGITQRGTERHLVMHRRGGDGAVVASEPAMTDKLKDGDVLYVRESLF